MLAEIVCKPTFGTAPGTLDRHTHGAKTCAKFRAGIFKLRARRSFVPESRKVRRRRNYGLLQNCCSQLCLLGQIDPSTAESCCRCLLVSSQICQPHLHAGLNVNSAVAAVVVAVVVVVVANGVLPMLLLMLLPMMLLLPMLLSL